MSDYNKPTENRDLIEEDSVEELLERSDELLFLYGTLERNYSSGRNWYRGP